MTPPTDPRQALPPWRTDPAIAAAIAMTALGLSVITTVLTTLNFGLREIRQDNAANNRALNSRLDATQQRIDSVSSPHFHTHEVTHGHPEAP